MKFSEGAKEIFGALAKLRGKVVQPQKTEVNPFFKSKYAPLESIVKAIDDAEPWEHGLYWSHNISNDEQGRSGAQVVITHESGEYIIYDWYWATPTKRDPHGEGSALTYAKRFTLSSAFGLAPDEDDDGNHATRPPQQAPPQQRQAPVDPAMEGKQNFLADKSAHFMKEYGVDKKTLYKELGKRLSTPSPINLPLADLVQTLNFWEKDLKAQKRAEESEGGAPEEVEFF